MKSDVSAIVLSNGERSTAPARASLARQRLPVREIIEVGPEVRPFHRAFNLASSRVSTEFFVQVDSDMVLDDDCVECLRECVTDRIGMVSGLLRDPLLTRIMGTKLLRTRCLDQTHCPDAIATESDLSAGLERAGWLMVYALAPGKPRPVRNTFGLHDPGYTLESTFAKFLVTASQVRSRGVGSRARSLLSQVLESRHRLGMVAGLAVARGYCFGLEKDCPRPFPVAEECAFIEAFLGGPDSSQSGAIEHVGLEEKDWRTLFERAAEVGQTLHLRRSPETFVRTFRHIYRTPSRSALVGAVGLCEGLFRNFEGDDPRYAPEHLAGLLN